MSRGHDLYGLTTGFVCRRRSECGSPSPRREFGKPAIRPVVDELGQHVGQICFRIDSVQFAALDQRGQHRPVFRPFVAAGEQSILSAESNHPFILPMSGRKLKFITGGTRSMGAASGDTTANSAPPGRLFTLRHARRGHGNRRMDAGSCRLRRYGNDRRAACDSIGAARASSSAQRARFQRKLPGRSHYRPGGTI